MRRNIVADLGRDPSDPKKRRFALTCGHAVSRRGASDKQWAQCGFCASSRGD